MCVKREKDKWRIFHYTLFKFGQFGIISLILFDFLKIGFSSHFQK